MLSELQSLKSIESAPLHVVLSLHFLVGRHSRLLPSAPPTWCWHQPQTHLDVLVSSLVDGTPRAGDRTSLHEQEALDVTYVTFWLHLVRQQVLWHIERPRPQSAAGVEGGLDTGTPASGTHIKECSCVLLHNKREKRVSNMSVYLNMPNFSDNIIIRTVLCLLP